MVILFHIFLLCFFSSAKISRVPHREPLEGTGPVRTSLYYPPPLPAPWMQRSTWLILSRLYMSTDSEISLTRIFNSLKATHPVCAMWTQELQPPALAFITHTSGLALPQHGYIMVLILQNPVSSPSPPGLLLPQETDTGEGRKKAGSRKKTPEDFSELAPPMIIQIQVLRPPGLTRFPLSLQNGKWHIHRGVPGPLWERLRELEVGAFWKLCRPSSACLLGGAGNQRCNLEHFLLPTSRPHSLVLH